MSYHRVSDIFKYKRRLPIKSLQAAICNVALFKSMKQKQFHDSIFISYCEDGVILQAINQSEWDKAFQYVNDFLIDKKISLLTYGYEKQTYQDLIIKGLKQYTKRVKQLGEQCPYINIIHYQKLRKSCQFMDKQKYSDPLRYWQSKNKTNPNFAFLVVQPKIKFQQVKKYLLQVLTKKQVQLTYTYLNLYQFIYLFFNSIHKDTIKDLCDKKIIEMQVVLKEDVVNNNTHNNININNNSNNNNYNTSYHNYNNNNYNSNILNTSQQTQQISSVKSKSINEKQQKFKLMSIINNCNYMIKIINYSDLILNQYDVKIIKHTNNLNKLGLEYISSKQIQKQIKTINRYLKSPVTAQGKTTLSITEIYENLHNQLISAISNTLNNNNNNNNNNIDNTTQSQQQSNKDNNNNNLNNNVSYSMIPYKRCQKQKYLNLLDKLLKSTINKNKNIQELNSQLMKFTICEYDQIEFISCLPYKGNINNINNDQNNNRKQSSLISTNYYNIYKASINDCPYMLLQFNSVPIEDLDTFILYLQQLKTYYCTYLIRFYGISIRYGQNIHPSHQQTLLLSNPQLLQKIRKKQSTLTHSFKYVSRSKIQQYSYYLIFDYHHRNFNHLIQKNDLILDNLQIANFGLQLLYLCQYLHTNDEPRCLGLLNLQQLYYPLSLILPYLGISTQYDQNNKTQYNQNNNKQIKSNQIFKMNFSQQGFQGDVRLIGNLIKYLLNYRQQDQQYSQNQSVNLQQSQQQQFQQGTIDRQLQIVYQLMIKQNKHQRITITKAISMLEDILAI